jgi:hypothetical protein
MKRTLLLSLLLLLGFVATNSISANPIERSHPRQAWSIDIGSGWFEPDDNLYENWFYHGLNLRAALSHRFRSGLILGLQYRYSQKDFDVEYNTWDSRTSEWSDDTFTPDIESINHWIGIRVGYDLIERSNAEMSLSGLLYLVEAFSEERRRRRGNYFDEYFGRDTGATAMLSYSETGVGLGATFLFAHSIGKNYTIGIEVEYNHTWLDYPESDHLTLNPGELPERVGPSYKIENVGGVWVVPFVRLRF